MILEYPRNDVALWLWGWKVRGQGHMVNSIFHTNGTSLYWWTEAHVYEQLAQSCYVEWNGRDSNLWPCCCKSDALTTTPPRHMETDSYRCRCCRWVNTMFRMVRRTVEWPSCIPTATSLVINAPVRLKDSRWFSAGALNGWVLVFFLHCTTGCHSKKMS